MKLWSEPAFNEHPFYIKLTEQLVSQIQTFFPGVKCEVREDPPRELSLNVMERSHTVRTKVRSDTNRK